jgi:hypothetical protein
MRPLIRLNALLLLFFAHSSFLANPFQREVSTEEKSQTMKEKYEAVARNLDTAGASPSLELFEQIGTEINSLPEAPKEDPEWRSWRRERLEFWLKAIDLIDRNEDPAFNPNDVPLVNVAPPPAAGLMSGVDPRYIKDPKLRQEYEQAIKHEAEKAKRYNLQYGLRQLDTNWTESIRVYIIGQYSAEPKDVREIKTLIDHTISKDSRKEQLRGFIVSRGKPQP